MRAAPRGQPPPRPSCPSMYIPTPVRGEGRGEGSRGCGSMPAHGGHPALAGATGQRHQRLARGCAPAAVNGRGSSLQYTLLGDRCDHCTDLSYDSSRLRLGQRPNKTPPALSGREASPRAVPPEFAAPPDGASVAHSTATIRSYRGRLTQQCPAALAQIACLQPTGSEVVSRPHARGRLAAGGLPSLPRHRTRTCPRQRLSYSLHFPV